MRKHVFGNRLCFAQKRQWTTDKKTAENIKEVEERIAETPNKSIRRLTQETNLSFGTIQLIHKKDLHFFPYRLLRMKLNPLTIRVPTT
jgi:hypothetical protein